MPHTPFEAPSARSRQENRPEVDAPIAPQIRFPKFSRETTERPERGFICRQLMPFRHSQISRKNPQTNPADSTFGSFRARQAYRRPARTLSRSSQRPRVPAMPAVVDSPARDACGLADGGFIRGRCPHYRALRLIQHPKTDGVVRGSRCVRKYMPSPSSGKTKYRHRTL